MNVLSLFDGMSCGQIALKGLGITVDNYYAAEIKKHAIAVTNHNFPKTIRLGDVRKITGVGLPKIDLVIGGSPCQDFSRANKVRNGLNGVKSMLFYEYMRILDEVRDINPDCKFLLENVIMESHGYGVISGLLGTEPVRICGSSVSAALRDRLYWTNIGPERFGLFGERICNIPQPKDTKTYLNDILETGFSTQRKHTCLNTSAGRDIKQESMMHRYNTTGMTTVIFADESLDPKKGLRYINQTEMEILHNIPPGYTSIVNKVKAGDLIGDGWTIGVVSHIFSYL